MASFSPFSALLHGILQLSGSITIEMVSQHASHIAWAEGHSDWQFAAQIEYS